jgi:predicted Zn-dependent protease
MNLALRTLIAIPLAGLLLAPAPAAAGRILGSWPASGIASNLAEEVRLTGGNGQVLATVNRARVARLVDVVSRIEAAAGISAQLFVVQTEDRQPNALAATGRDGRNKVGITPAMLELLGDDDDAYAALIGHEVAHLTQRHGAERASRQGLMQGLGLVATLLAGARGNVNASRVINFGGILVDRSYSREEERDADRLGIGFASAAGYDPQGAVRLFERMASAGRTAPLAFLSTHPGGGERLASARATIASLPSGQRASDARDVTQENAPPTPTALWSERDYAATGSTASQQEREHAAAIAMALQQERHDAEIGARLAAEALRALQSDVSAGHPVAWPAPQPENAD